MPTAHIVHFANVPKKPVLPETFRKAFKEEFPTLDVSEGDTLFFTCPACGCSIAGEIKRTTFMSEAEKKLISVWYVGHGDDKDHGFGYRSKFCERTKGGKKRWKSGTVGKIYDQPVTIDAPVVMEPKQEEPEPVNAPIVQPKSDKLTDLLVAAIKGDIDSVVQGAIDRTIGQLQASGALTTQITHTIKRIDGSSIDVPPEAHCDLVKVMKAVEAGVRNILLVGPGGSGKTSLAFDLIRALKIEAQSYDTFSHMTEPERVYGYRDLLNGGKYVSTPFVEVIGKRSVSIFDEFDAMNSNTAVPLNSYLANGKLVTACGPIDRHGDNIFVGIANTYGHGPTRMYAGRNQLDAATLDRFFVITVGYDTKLEKRLFPSIDHAFIASVRERIEKNGIRRLFGTRTLQRITALIAMGEGDDTQSAVKALISQDHENWSREDVSMAGID